MSTCQITPRYCVLASRKSLGERIPPERIRMVMERGAEEMQEILTTDEAIQRFHDPLPLNVQSVGLGSSGNRVTVVAEVPLTALRRLADGANRVMLRWQLRVRAPGQNAAVSEDRQRGLVLPPPMPEGREKEAVVTLVDEQAVPAGWLDVRLVLSDTLGQAGALYHREGMIVLGPGQPGLSDVILMPTQARGPSSTIAGQTVHLSPTFAPGATQELEIGFVLAGLAGSDVPVAIAIRKVGDDSARTRFSVGSTEHPATARQFIRRRLGLKELDDGAYDLIVTATLPDGTTQERVQRILVRE